MKKLTNKNFIQKRVIAILIVLTFNFTVPTVSNADFGGTLLSPLIDLVASIGDTCLSALHWMLNGGERTLEIGLQGVLMYFQEEHSDITSILHLGPVGEFTVDWIYELFTGGEYQSIYNDLEDIDEAIMNGGRAEISMSGKVMVPEVFFDPVTFDAVPTGKEKKKITINEDSLETGWFSPISYEIPAIEFSPEIIFKNEIPGLDANFINPKTRSR